MILPILEQIILRWRYGAELRMPVAMFLNQFPSALGKAWDPSFPLNLEICS